MRIKRHGNTVKLWASARDTELEANMGRKFRVVYDDTYSYIMQDDDGQEFVMLNLLHLNPEPIPDPATGEPKPAGELLQRYLGPFMRQAARRAGHPLLQARKVGPYVDSWGCEPDPGWTLVGSMRYRSRRDMIELALDPRFQAGHGLKHAAMPVTFSFPTQRQPAGLMGPRVWVGLVLALAAALVQLATVG